MEKMNTKEDFLKRKISSNALRLPSSESMRWWRI